MFIKIYVLTRERWGAARDSDIEGTSYSPIYGDDTSWQIYLSFNRGRSRHECGNGNQEAKVEEGTVEGGH